MVRQKFERQLLISGESTCTISHPRVHVEVKIRFHESECFWNSSARGVACLKHPQWSRWFSFTSYLDNTIKLSQDSFAGEGCWQIRMVYGHPVPSTFTAYSLTHMQKLHITKYFSPLFNARCKIPIIRPANVSFLHPYTLIITSPIHTLMHMYAPPATQSFKHLSSQSISCSWHLQEAHFVQVWHNLFFPWPHVACH